MGQRIGAVLMRRSLGEVTDDRVRIKAGSSMEQDEESRMEGCGPCWGL